MLPNQANIFTNSPRIGLIKSVSISAKWAPQSFQLHALTNNPRPININIPPPRLHPHIIHNSIVRRDAFTWMAQTTPHNEVIDQFGGRTQIATFIEEIEAILTIAIFRSVHSGSRYFDKFGDKAVIYVCRSDKSDKFDVWRKGQLLFSASLVSVYK